MKKILCLLMTFMMLFSNIVFAESFIDVEENSDLGITISFLTQMGIINGYDDDTFRGDEKITRAEFAVMVARMLKLPEQIESNNVYYVDVPASHWAAGSIEQLTERRYFSGKSNGYFGVNDSVTVDEAVTVFLRICGYEPLAEAQGGFPMGYSRVASDTRLLKGVSVKSAAIFRKDMAVLIENTFNLGMYSIHSMSSLGSAGYDVSDDTILSTYWNMYHTEGIVTATNGTNLYGGSDSTECITIEGYTYDVDESEDYIDYLGTYVTAYFTEKDDIQTLYFIAKSDRDNTITKINYDEISSVNQDYSISYYDGKKTRTEKLNNDVKVIYNGVCLSSFTLDVFEIEYGYLELVETKSDGVGVVKVWDFETCFVTSVDSTKNYIYGKNITDYIDLSDDLDVRIIKNRSMENIDFSKISVKNILTVARYGKTARVYLSEEVLDTNIESIDSSENEITADGVEYSIVPCYVDTFTSKFKIEGLKLYLDIFGNIAYAEGKNDSGETFAYLINGFIDTEAFDEQLVLKLFMQDGSIQKLYVSEKVRIDGVRYKTAEEQKNALSSGNKFISQLVNIKLNSENQITYIDTPYINEGVENEYTLSEHIPFNSVGYRFKWNGSIGGKGVMSDSTIIFVVPTDDEVKDAEEKKFDMAKRGDYADNTLLPLISYKTSPKIGYEQVCVVKKNMNGTMNDGVGCVVISRINKALNSDEEVVTQIEGYTNGVKKEILCTADSGIETDTFKEGDVVRFALNNFGEATSNYTVEVKVDDVMNNVKPNWAPSNDTTSIDANYKKTYGFPYEAEDKILRVAYNLGDKWSEVYEVAGTYTLVDTSESRRYKVSSCTINDIHTYDVYKDNCDKIFVQIKNSSIVSVVVFR